VGLINSNSVSGPLPSAVTVAVTVEGPRRKSCTQETNSVSCASCISKEVVQSNGRKVSSVVESAMWYSTAYLSERRLESCCSAIGILNRIIEDGTVIHNDGLFVQGKLCPHHGGKNEERKRK
jgi:hypothetical protein